MSTIDVKASPPRERVVFIPASADLGAASPTTLASRPQGTIAAVEAFALLSCIDAGVAWPLLYLDRAGYDDAVRGLDEVEAHAALDLRLQRSGRWAGAGASVARFAAGRWALALALHAPEEGEAAALHAASLDEVAIFGGFRGVASERVASLVRRVIEGEARVVALLDAAEAEADGDPGAAACAESIARARAWSEEACARVRRAASGGRDDASLPLHVPLERVVWVRPNDERLRAWAERRFLPRVPLDDGLALEARTDVIDDLDRQHYQVSLLVPSGDVLPARRAETTPAELAAWLRRARARAPRPFFSLLARARDAALDQHVARAALRRRTLDTAPDIAASLDDIEGGAAAWRALARGAGAGAPAEVGTPGEEHARLVADVELMRRMSAAIDGDVSLLLRASLERAAARAPLLSAAGLTSIEDA